MIDIRLDWELAQQAAGRLDSPRGSGRRGRQVQTLSATTSQGPGRGQPALRGFLRRVKTDPPIGYVQAATELEFLRRVQAADSPWPIDTGYSRSGFAFLSRGDEAVLVNRAGYAPYVEERTGALAELLADPAITRAAEATLEEYAARYRP